MHILSASLESLSLWYLLALFHLGQLSMGAFTILQLMLTTDMMDYSNPHFLHLNQQVKINLHIDKYPLKHIL